MKIACIGSMDSFSGAPKQMLKLINALADRGHEIYVLAIIGLVDGFDFDSRVKVVDLSYAEKQAGIKTVNRFNALREAIGEVRPDVSICYTFLPVYLMIAMSRAVTGKVIYSDRADPGSYTTIRKFLRKTACWHADGFVFQTRVAQKMTDTWGKPSVVIRNSVNIPDRFSEPCVCREKKVICCSRLAEQKNIPMLIDAFAKIADRFPDYVLENYGDGVLRGVLQDKIDKLGLQNRILLKPAVKNILDLVYSSSVSVLTSDYEGMPNALMEAMALGVPCITSDYSPGSAGELIQNGVNGFIVPKGDSEALAEKMAYLLENRDVAERMAHEAMKIKDNHTDKVIFDMWNEFITKVVG